MPDLQQPQAVATGGPNADGPRQKEHSVVANTPVLVCGRFRLALDRPRVMGILNLTADSFSGDGHCQDVAAATAAALAMIEDGADLIDIGAESTRPGAEPVDEDLEWQRLEPVLDALAPLAVPISVDTRRPRIMARAIAAGASLVNDVSGFRDPAAIAAIARAPAPVAAVVMHMQGEPRTMQQAPRYEQAVAEVAGFLAARRAALLAAGIGPERVCIDPGFGFGKTLAHNLALLAQLQQIAAIAPVLAGLSRKSMLGLIVDRPVSQRLGASIAAALVAVEKGAAIVRVHDVAESVSALAVWRAAKSA